MRIRANHIVAAVFILVAGVVGFVLLSAYAPLTKKGPESSDDVIEIARQEAAQNPATAQNEVGGEPPGGVDPTKTPVIDVPERFDAGLIPNDKPSEKTLMVRNTGTYDLILGEITTSCACTVGKVDKKVVPPGGEVPMTITIEPKRIPGFTSEKLLTVMSNDPKKSQARIVVTATVEPEFSVEPNKVDFGQVQKGQTAKAQVILRQVQDAPFKDKPFEVQNVKVSEEKPAIQASVAMRPESEWAVAGHREYVVDVTFDSSAVPVGAFDAVLSMDTTCERLFNYRVFVHAEVTAAGDAAPAGNPS